MTTKKIILKKVDGVLVVALLVSTVLFVLIPITEQANAEEIGQIKVKEGFETWPPAGWILQSPLSIIQTTGFPGYECMVGYHAAKIFRTDNKFFCFMYTPTFNGKKGGGNMLTFWHKQAFLDNNNDVLAVFVTNDLSNYVQITGYTSSADWTYEKINLNDFIHTTKTMQVLFLTILLNDGDNVYLDEVIITGISGE